MHDGVVELNLYLELSDIWIARARDLARRLKRLGNAVNLDETVPHVTVYLATFPAARKADVVAALSELARGREAIRTRVSSVRPASHGYFFLDVGKTRG